MKSIIGLSWPGMSSMPAWNKAAGCVRCWSSYGGMDRLPLLEAHYRQRLERECVAEAQEVQP